MSCIYPETLGIPCKSVGKVAFERAKRKPLFSTLQLSTVRALCISSETSSLMLHSLEETQVEAWLANLQTLIPRRSLALIYENLFHHEERWQGSWLHPWSFSRTNQMKLQWTWSDVVTQPKRRKQLDLRPPKVPPAVNPLQFCNFMVG